MRYIIALMSLAVICTGCALSSGATESNDEPLASPTVEEPSPTAPVADPTTPSTQPTITVVITAEQVCQPRQDWPTTYTVVAGDTLTNIAQRSGTSVDQLVSGNCLQDANALSVGQVLRVPRQLIQEIDGALTLSPIVENRNGTLILQPGATITIQWPGAPENALVSFIESNFLVDGGVAPIGDDTQVGAEGASITYVVPNEINGNIYAGARLPGQGGEYVESNRVAIQTVGFGTGNCRYVAPAMGGPHRVYASADNTSTSLGEAQQNTEYTVTGRTQGTFNGQAIDFLAIQYNGQAGYVPYNNVPLRGDCTAFGLP